MHQHLFVIYQYIAIYIDSSTWKNTKLRKNKSTKRFSKNQKKRTIIPAESNAIRHNNWLRRSAASVPGGGCVCAWSFSECKINGVIRVFNDSSRRPSCVKSAITAMAFKQRPYNNLSNSFAISIWRKRTEQKKLFFKDVKHKINKKNKPFRWLCTNAWYCVWINVDNSVNILLWVTALFSGPRNCLITVHAMSTSFLSNLTKKIDRNNHTTKANVKL